ncbi:unnamed protein product [Clonostachys rosea]|uniref:Uncharacterized protein n=1 Tax=Bionectria ochroleuca TaxID=29856 RepID=A0ABY6URX1_BIOOC|nr:unnamed protein product [Clonostachys rosea]
MNKRLVVYGRRVLERELEAVVCPVVHIIIHMHLAGDDHIDMFEEGQVERRGDGVHLVQDDGAAIIALLERLQDARGRVLSIFAGRRDEAIFVVVSWRRIRSGHCRTVWRGDQRWSIRD